MILVQIKVLMLMLNAELEGRKHFNYLKYKIKTIEEKISTKLKKPI